MRGFEPANGDILARIDATLDGRCPCGAEPAPGSPWCSEDCRPVIGAGLAYRGEHQLESTCEQSDPWPDNVAALAAVGFREVGETRGGGRIWVVSNPVRGC